MVLIAAIRPPMIPKQSAITTNKGNMTAAARILGNIKNETGSKESDSRASICSDTRIVPISAAMVAPIFPVITNAVIIGANSMRTDSPTTLPTNQLGTNPDSN